MASRSEPPSLNPAPPAGRRSADGDAGAWMLQYAPALRRYFQRRAEGRDVDDLVQDVFVRLHARGAASDIDNLEGYLFRTAANVLAKRYQRGRWRWGGQVPLDQVPDIVDELSPERILIGREALERVLRTLDDLPPRAAEAFVMFRFEHLSQQTIARRMGISVKGVQKLLHRAMLQLMRQLEPRR